MGRSKHLNPLCKEYYENSGLTDTEITEKISYIQKTRSPLAIEYYIVRDIPLTVAKQKIAEIQKTRANTNPNSCRTIKYWIGKGFSEEEAKQQVSNIQSRNLDFFVTKYGPEIGQIKYNELVTKAKQNLSAGAVNRNGCKSKIANTIIDLLSTKLPYDIQGGSQSNEYRLTRKNKTFFYDAYIKELNLVLELHGSYSHADPYVYGINPSQKFYKKTATRIRRKDLLKQLVAESYGNTVLTFWLPLSDSYSAKLNLVTHIKYCINQHIQTYDYTKTINTITN